MRDPKFEIGQEAWYLEYWEGTETCPQLECAYRRIPKKIKIQAIIFDGTCDPSKTIWYANVSVINHQFGVNYFAERELYATEAAAKKAAEEEE